MLQLAAISSSTSEGMWASEKPWGGRMSLCPAFYSFNIYTQLTQVAEKAVRQH